MIFQVDEKMFKPHVKETLTDFKLYYDKRYAEGSKNCVFVVIVLFH